MAWTCSGNTRRSCSDNHESQRIAISFGERRGRTRIGIIGTGVCTRTCRGEIDLGEILRFQCALSRSHWESTRSEERDARGRDLSASLALQIRFFTSRCHMRADTQSWRRHVDKHVFYHVTWSIISRPITPGMTSRPNFSSSDLTVRLTSSSLNAWLWIREKMKVKSNRILIFIRFTIFVASYENTSSTRLLMRCTAEKMWLY